MSEIIQVTLGTRRHHRDSQRRSYGYSELRRTTTIATIPIISTQLLESTPIVPYLIAPTWLIGEYERASRDTPEQQAERAKRQAEHDRRRAAWWASLTRTQRFHIANRRRRARARTKISDVRANVALKIAPWLDDRDW